MICAIAAKETTADKLAALEAKLALLPSRAPQSGPLRQQVEELRAVRDTERLTEIAAELQGIPRYGPEAANLRQEQEEVQQRVAARQQEQQQGEAAKTKIDKPTTNKARDKEKQSGTNNGKEKPNKQSGKVSATPRTGYIFSFVEIS